MKKYNKAYAIGMAVNAATLAAVWISFAVWTVFAVKYGKAQVVYKFMAVPIIISFAAVAVMLYNKKIASSKDKFADSNTLHIAAFVANVVDLALTNVYFAMVLGVVDIKIEKFVAILLVGVYYLLDVLFLLMSKGYASALNNYYDVENDKELGKKIGKIAGLSLLVCNTVMLIIALTVVSFVISIVVTLVNTATVVISVIFTEAKYGKKNYL